jgi:hypothetical protein
MCTSDEDFKNKIEGLCKDRKYNVEFEEVGSDPKVTILARIKKESNGRRIEVTCMAVGYTLIVVGENKKERFKKDELDRLIQRIQDILR